MSNLLTRRVAHGYSQQALADLAGVSQALLWKLENATKAPKGLRTALALAAVLHCQITDLWPEAAPKRLTQRSPPNGARSRTTTRKTARKTRGKRNSGGN